MSKMSWKMEVTIDNKACRLERQAIASLRKAIVLRKRLRDLEYGDKQQYLNAVGNLFKLEHALLAMETI
jgi:hypothetical protein